MAYTYLSNAYRTAEEFIYSLGGHSRIVEDAVANSYYFPDSVEAIDGALYFLFEMFDEEKAGNGKFMVVVPIKSDVERFLRGEDYSNQYWYRKLTSTAKEKGVVVVDLMKYLSEANVKKMFHTCDAHWRPSGAEWAARVLALQIQRKRKSRNIEP